MTARNPWDFATPLDARALGAMAWAPPQLPLFPPPQADDNADVRQSPSNLDRARSAGLLSLMGVSDRGLPVSGLGMSLPVVGLHPPADASATDGSNGFLNFTTSQSPPLVRLTQPRPVNCRWHGHDPALPRTRTLILKRA
jgi:hypothetical protein